eukprot:jgi/Ulvmu1/3221/UM015_0262.1
MSSYSDAAKQPARGTVTEHPPFLTNIDREKVKAGVQGLDQHIQHLRDALGSVKNGRSAATYEAQCKRIHYLSDLSTRMRQTQAAHATARCEDIWYPEEHMPKRRTPQTNGAKQLEATKPTAKKPNRLLTEAFKATGNTFYGSGPTSTHLAPGAKRVRAPKPVAPPTSGAALKKQVTHGNGRVSGQANNNFTPRTSQRPAPARHPVRERYNVPQTAVEKPTLATTNVIDLLGSDDEDPIEEEVSAAIRSKLDGPDSDDRPLPELRASGYSASRTIPMEKELEGLHYVYPEHGGVGAVDVNGHDLRTLQDMEFVNDKIMDYYSKRIHEQYAEWCKSGYTKVKIHFFNAFFFKKLTEHGSGRTFAQTEQVTKEMYEKVCKWTKNVDIFDMDYILIPIHDTAHWSLAIVCHPGHMLIDKQQAIAAKQKKVEDTVRDKEASEDEKYKVLCNDAFPLIMHLDPIKAGGHDTDSVGSALKQWLRYERQHHAEHRKDTRAGRHEAMHAHELTQLSQAGALDVDAGDVKIHRVNTIPHQDNYHDCGLYTLTYMEFFCYNTPQQIHCFRLNGARPQLHMHFGKLRQDDAFLKAAWFRQRNGSNLRFHLMVHLLKNMIEKANRDGLAEKMQDALHTAAAIKLDYQQRFQDDRGNPTDDMYYTPKQKADNPSRFLSKQTRPRQPSICDSMIPHSRTRYTRRKKYRPQVSVEEVDEDEERNDQEGKKRQEELDENYHPHPQPKTRARARSTGGWEPQNDTHKRRRPIANRSASEDAVQQVTGVQQQVSDAKYFNEVDDKSASHISDSHISGSPQKMHVDVGAATDLTGTPEHGRVAGRSHQATSHPDRNFVRTEH